MLSDHSTVSYVIHSPKPQFCLPLKGDKNHLQDTLYCCMVYTVKHSPSKLTLPIQSRVLDVSTRLINAFFSLVISPTNYQTPTLCDSHKEASLSPESSHPYEHLHDLLRPKVKSTFTRRVATAWWWYLFLWKEGEGEV